MHNIPEAPAIEGATHVHSGKVRDLYRLEDGGLLMVASDRISAYDFVLDSTIPDKGEILTRMSLWWFAQLADLVPNHVRSTDVPESVKGRAIVCEELGDVSRGVRRARLPHRLRPARLPVHRRGVRDRAAQGAPGEQPPAVADLHARRPRRRWATMTRTSPTTASSATSAPTAAAELRDLTLAVYSRAECLARERGIILADTKLEFGSRLAAAAGDSGGIGTTVLADEVLTPDSSRYWPAADWEPGRVQVSYDKQIVRNWLLSDASGWDRNSGATPPALPPEVVDRTRARYVEAFEMLTGERF